MAPNPVVWVIFLCTVSLPLAKAELQYAFTNFTDQEGMIKGFQKAETSFANLVALSNSFVLAMNTSHGWQFADATRAAFNLLDWDYSAVYLMTNAIRKGVSDAIRYNQDSGGIVWTIDYLLYINAPDPEKPFAGLVISYCWVVMDLIEKGDAKSVSTAAQAFIDTFQVRTWPPVSFIPRDSLLESLSAGVTTRGCPVMNGMLQESWNRAVSQGPAFSSSFNSTVSKWTDVYRCMHSPNGTLPEQVGSPAFSINLVTTDWPNAALWASQIATGTPLGSLSVTKRKGEYSTLMADDMQYGIFERAASRFIVAIVNGGAVADLAVKTVEQMVQKLGCATAVVPLLNAKAIARASGISGTFYSTISTSSVISQCLSQGYDAFQS